MRYSAAVSAVFCGATGCVLVVDVERRTVVMVLGAWALTVATVVVGGRVAVALPLSVEAGAVGVRVEVFEAPSCTVLSVWAINSLNHILTMFYTLTKFCLLLRWLLCAAVNVLQSTSHRMAG